MAITRSTRRRPRVEIINMVDVMFFLLSFFLVFSTLRVTPATLDLDLPRAATAVREAAPEIEVTIDRSGRYSVDGSPVTLTQMGVLAGDAVRRHPDQLVVIRADKGVQYDLVVQAIDVLRRAGAYRIGLAVELRPAPSLGR